MTEKINQSDQKIWTFSFAVLILIAILVSMCVSVIIPAMPIIMRNGGFSYSFITYTFVMLIVGRFISSNMTGIVLDRYLPHKILFYAFILHTITMCCFAFVRSEYVFVILRFMEGVFEGIVSVVLQVMVIALSKPENRGRKMGIFSSAYGIGFIIGPVIGGIALQIFGASGVFLAVAALMLVGLIGLVMAYKTLAKDILIIPAQKRSFNLEFLRHIPLYSGAILQRGLFVSLAILLPLFLFDFYKLQSYQIGLYFMASAIITSILMPITGRLADKPYRDLIVIYSILVMGFSIIGFGFATNEVVFTCLYLIETIAFSFMVPAAMKIFGDSVDKHPHRGQIVGTASSSREILNIILVFCLIPIYKYNFNLPWIILGIMSVFMVLPYVVHKRRASAIVFAQED